MLLASAAQMQQLDKITIEEVGIPGVVLMENAGKGCTDLILKYFPAQVSSGTAIVAGKGNNGGDGFVIARWLHHQGFRVCIYLLADPASLKGDAAINFEIVRRLNLPLIIITDETELDQQAASIKGAGLIVDAILGTGLTSEVGGLFGRAIDLINAGHEAGKTVVAVDIPSGLNADNGRIMGRCVNADLTVTFGLAKLGQIVFPGFSHVGRLEVVDISIPSAVVAAQKLDCRLITTKIATGIIKRKALDSHKGRYGHLLVLAGSPGKTGAAAMTAQSALRAGAGLVTLGIPAGLNPVMEAKLTEVMTESLPQTDQLTFAPDALQPILTLLGNKGALAVGPGISTHPDTAGLILELLPEVTVPMVIDADGLNILNGHLDVLKSLKAKAVLTPHPGEMARMLGLTVHDVQYNRTELARRFASEYGVVLVLKGARTVVADPDSGIYINSTGGPALSAGGTGDVLTGILGGLLAQGYAPIKAAVAATWVRGRAADMLAKDRGDTGLLATEISDQVPLVFKGLGEKTA
ncbi:MAG: NAD(P)H-hydrate dehydratase [Deltaproteobacteria bacterium]|nr:NAD(P)H-hydrate dehydratase [Deltaproteobacteria bacterium]